VVGCSFIVRTRRKRYACAAPFSHLGAAAASTCPAL